MTLSSLFQTSPWATPLALLLGLALSFAFRRRPWVFFIWLPTTGVFAYVAYRIVRIFSAIGKMSGPEAGFAGMMGILLLPALAICLVGLVAALFCRPRRETWRLSTVIPAAIFWLGAAMLIDFGNSTRVEIQLLDTSGNALAGVGIKEHVNENGLKMQVRSLKSNAQGKFSFGLQPGQGVALEIQPRADPPGSYERKPTFWNLGIREMKGNPDKLVLRHHWQRSVGGQTLNEGFSEIIPNTSQIQMVLVLPDHGSLDPEPRQKRIRDAFNTFVAERPPELEYSSVCRNVEAIEFIPELLEAYRTEQDRAGLIDGLAQIAEILSELDRACRSVRGNIPEGGFKPQRDQISQPEYQFQQFCLWAQIPPVEWSDPALAMERAKAKIDASASQLTEFALAQMPDNAQALKILAELRQLGRPTISQLVEAILKHPPKGNQAEYSHHQTLWMIGAKFADLAPLYASDDPVIVMTAFEATPNNQLEGPIAAEALARLEAVYPSIPEDAPRKRVEMHMNMLRARFEQRK